MSTIDDLRLMAYADGELDAASRAEVEAALRADTALSARVAEMVALRTRLQVGLGAELDEPVPDRLAGLLRPAASGATVVDLAAARASRVPQANAPARWGWATWGGMAASFLAGVLLARTGWMTSEDTVAFATRDGTVIAQGAVAHALSTRLAGDPAGIVAIQLSFVDRRGRYCRTFAIERAAGLACREGEAWAVQALAPAVSDGGGTALRQAATALPSEVLQAVDASIDGNTLDSAAERNARDRGWTR
ncbi:MAG TPA: zf-HC2 domain-containing protein [Burkholderiaceae bacterium]|nr:zf-HC2 domain-containing protein [Burkholderiaceae bacterium]